MRSQWFQLVLLTCVSAGDATVNTLPPSPRRSIIRSQSELSSIGSDIPYFRDQAPGHRSHHKHHVVTPGGVARAFGEAALASDATAPQPTFSHDEIMVPSSHEEIMVRRATPVVAAVPVAPVAPAPVAPVAAAPVAAAPVAVAPVAVAPVAIAPAAPVTPAAAAPVVAASAEDSGGLGLYVVFKILFFCGIVAGGITLLLKWYMNKQVAGRLSGVARDVKHVEAVAKGVRSTHLSKKGSKSGVRSSKLQAPDVDTGTESDNMGPLLSGQDRGRGGPAQAGSDSGSASEKVSMKGAKSVPGEQRPKDLGTKRKNSPLMSKTVTS